jgi:hypothetical protein
MENRQIGFELAKIAKDKGFVPRTVTTIYTNRYLLGGKDVMITDTCIYLWMTELQRWLRDNHNLHIGITVNQFGYGYMYSIINTKRSECVKYLTGGPNNKFSYEDALEEGLLESLKLMQ